jgi:hypothetical protein
MVKIRIVELFKPYNFYFGFKFKNSKDRDLFKNFGLNLNFSKFLSLVK